MFAFLKIYKSDFLTLQEVSKKGNKEIKSGLQ